MRFLLLGLVSLAAIAQDPPNPVTIGSSFDISGVVNDAVTGKPVNRAAIALESTTGPANTKKVVTDRTGNFLLKNVPIGTYDLTVQAQGYAQNESSYRKVILVGGTQATRYTLGIQPQATLTGVVTNEDGEPVANAQIVVLRSVIVGGYRRLEPRESTHTNDLGAYRLAGLGQGACYVAVLAPPMLADPEDQQAFPPTFAPNVTDPLAAQVVSLRPANEQRADIQLSSQPAYHIRGRIDPSSQEARVALTAGVDSITSLPVAYASAFDPKTSEFVLSGIPSGDYFLHVVLRDSGDAAAFHPVSVRDSDVVGINVSVSKSPALTGTVQSAGDQSAAEGVTAIGIHSLFNGASAPVRNGAFTITQAVPPRKYQVAPTLAPNWYVQSATQGGSDVLRNGVLISEGGSLPLSLVVSPRGASLEATVTWPDAGPRPPARVVVLQENGGEMLLVAETRIMPPNPPAVVRPALIGGIPPGDYVVYAFSEPVTIEYAKPAALSSFDSSSQTLHLDEAGQGRAGLKLILNP